MSVPGKEVFQGGPFIKTLVPAGLQGSLIRILNLLYPITIQTSVLPLPNRSLNRNCPSSTVFLSFNFLDTVDRTIHQPNDWMDFKSISRIERLQSFNQSNNNNTHRSSSS